MLIRLVPLLTGILPVAAIHGAYWIAIRAATVPACIPYVSGCTSISATGRYPPASYLFKAVMMPNAVLLVVYWLLAAAWLRALSRQYGGAVSRFTALDIVVAGAGGALALILYVTFLGTQEAFYEVMRRFGIYFYFLLTVIAQLLLASRARRIARHHSLSYLHSLATAQWLLALTPVVLGVLNVAVKEWRPELAGFENAIEWLAAIVMQVNIALSYFAWNASGFEATFSTRNARLQEPESDQ
jgi:hypothetical protein